jgi:hypothetical protein|tara:strand:+ start:808 stop:1059 length:252 start_codon:yes stop_codon:yes gene_type:complete
MSVSFEELVLYGIYWFAAIGISLLTIFILAREVLKRWRLNYRLDNNDETLLSDSSVKVEVLTSAPEGSSFVDSVPAILVEKIE